MYDEKNAYATRGMRFLGIFPRSNRMQVGKGAGDVIDRCTIVTNCGTHMRERGIRIVEIGYARKYMFTALRRWRR